jgi:hypothetical protein
VQESDIGDAAVTAAHIKPAFMRAGTGSIPSVGQLDVAYETPFEATPKVFVTPRTENRVLMITASDADGFTIVAKSTAAIASSDTTAAGGDHTHPLSIGGGNPYLGNINNSGPPSGRIACNAGAFTDDNAVTSGGSHTHAFNASNGTTPGAACDFDWLAIDL